MIFDHISGLETYARGDARLTAVAEFLKAHPAQTLADGRHELGKGAFVNVGDVPAREDGDFEAHRRYIDLQLVIKGSERMQWAHLSCMRSGGEYNERGDFQLFSGPCAEAAELKAYPGYFAVFYPQDAHKPSLHLDHAVSRKAVFKIPV